MEFIIFKKTIQDLCFNPYWSLNSYHKVSLGENEMYKQVDLNVYQ